VIAPREVLGTYVGQARWFGGKGRTFSISGGRRLGEVPGHVEGGPRVAIDLVTVSYEDSGENEYYQVPLAFYP
jgi:maltokinase